MYMCVLQQICIHKARQTRVLLSLQHDTTVAAMLSVFGMYDGIQPPYAAVFIIELYSEAQSNK